MPGVLYLAFKYLYLHFTSDENGPRLALSSNASLGGDSTHRGAVLGAILGCVLGADALPRSWIDSLNFSGSTHEDARESCHSLLRATIQSFGTCVKGTAMKKNSSFLSAPGASLPSIQSPAQRQLFRVNNRSPLVSKLMVPSSPTVSCKA